MTRRSYCHSVLLAAMMAASAAYAGADIVKCVDQAGHATLTDALCGDGSRTVLVAGSSDEGAPAETGGAPENPAAAPAIAVERVAPSRAPVRHDTWAGQRHTGRMFARDIETLKAARLSMRVLDEASATLRHQRLAGLN